MKPFYSLFVCVLAFLLSGISQHATPAQTMGTQQTPQAASPYPWVGAGGEALVGSAAGDSFERFARSTEGDANAWIRRVAFAVSRGGI